MKLNHVTSYPAPPPAQAQAHETQAQAHAQAAHAHTQLEPWRAGLCEVFGGGAAGIIALANFSRLVTILLDVFSTAVAMLFAKSAPGIFGGCFVSSGAFTFGSYVGRG